MIVRPIGVNWMIYMWKKSIVNVNVSRLLEEKQLRQLMWVNFGIYKSENWLRNLIVEEPDYELTIGNKDVV